MAKSIEQQILKATGIAARKDGEDQQKYLARLVRAANGLDDKAFGKLSEEVQEWLNEAADELNEKKPITLPTDMAEDAPEEPAPKKGKATKGKAKADAEEEEEPDDDEEPADDDDEEPADDDEEEPADDDEPAPKKGKGKPAPKKEAKAPKKGKAKEEDDEGEPVETRRKPGGNKKAKGHGGSVAVLRQLCCKHPDWDKKRVQAKLEEQGIEVSPNTLSIHYYEARAILAILRSIGKLKD